jgi:formate-dependent nitrite reductase membrane component NrfD
VRRPEKDTRPRLFYQGAHAATLDPLAARRPGGGLFLWSQQKLGGQSVVGGHPETGGRSPAGSAAAALLAYDVPHEAPWGWKVSLYTVTKAIAAGAYLAPLALLLGGKLDPASPLWRLHAPLLALAFLALTGALLVADLTHPARFWLIFARPHWRSWLVRGAFLIAGYGGALAAHLAAALAGRSDLLAPIALAGAPLALATAVYTAFLFAQAKARDLWQSPALPVQMAVQTFAAGAAAIYPSALATAPEAGAPLPWILFGAVALHFALAVAEIQLPPVTAHARLASWEMTCGRFRSYFRTGLACAGAALFAPWAGAATPAAAAALAFAAIAGLLAHEHAYVQAGQAVPLA